MSVKFTSIFDRKHPTPVSAKQFLAECLTMSSDYVYRGHGDYKWKLIPSAFRTFDGKTVPIPKIMSAFEYYMSDRFASDFSKLDASGAHIEGLKLDEDSSYARLQKLVFFQHFGIPTPLLDWTDSPLVALFMAHTFKPYESKKVRIYRLNQDNKPDSLILEKYEKLGFERIRRQLGGVTFCGTCKDNNLRFDSTLITDLIKKSGAAYRNTIERADVTLEPSDGADIDAALRLNGFTLENLFPNSPYWSAKAITTKLPWFD